MRPINGLIPRGPCNCREGITRALFDEAISIVSLLVAGADDVHHADKPEGKSPGDSTFEGIRANQRRIRATKLKDTNCRVDFNCVKRRLCNKCHNIIGARWTAMLNMVDGQIGAKCCLTTMGSKDKI